VDGKDVDAKEKGGVILIDLVIDRADHCVNGRFSIEVRISVKWSEMLKMDLDCDFFNIFLAI